MRGTRLDILLVRRGLAESRERARRLILAGEVLVDGEPVTKVALPVADGADVQVKERLPYVSRGGLKLEHALDAFGVDPTARVVADVGASTGGFTDCLLQRGAARVYAIDVGYGQLAWGLRQDPRVVVMERTNARHLETLPEAVDLVTVDASFISLRLLLPRVRGWLAPGGEALLLVKPQFEAGRRQVGKGGVVRSAETHRQVLRSVVEWARADGWKVLGLTPSPIRGPKGNVEFLLWVGTEPMAEEPDAEGAIERALSEVPAPTSAAHDDR